MPTALRSIQLYGKYPVSHRVQKSIQSPAIQHDRPSFRKRRPIQIGITARLQIRLFITANPLLQKFHKRSRFFGKASFYMNKFQTFSIGIAALLPKRADHGKNILYNIHPADPDPKFRPAFTRITNKKRLQTHLPKAFFLQNRKHMPGSLFLQKLF